MNILFLGDVVGTAGCRFVAQHLPALKQLKGVDICIANGENSHDHNGMTKGSADALFRAGVDIITGGNHTFQQRDCYNLLEEHPHILRPANYPPGAPGKGIILFDMGRYSLCVINLLGAVYLPPIDNPFHVVDALLEKVDTPNIFVDFHAEATSEKLALSRYLDGRVSAVIGTHTHVQTADEQILPGGTGYLTDAGMCGPCVSVLGASVEMAIHKFRTGLPIRFEVAEGACRMEGVLLSIDHKTGKAMSIERISVC